VAHSGVATHGFTRAARRRHGAWRRQKLAGAVLGGLAAVALIAPGAGAHGTTWNPIINGAMCTLAGDNSQLGNGQVRASSVNMAGPCNWVQVQAFPGGPVIAGGYSATSTSASAAPWGTHTSYHWIGWVFLYAGPYYLN
jgi:hypothetical protein